MTVTTHAISQRIGKKLWCIYMYIYNDATTTKTTADLPVYTIFLY